jgi:two-component system chemotaxis response regulator CheY
MFLERLMDLSNYTALVVDDFSTMRRIVINLLREAGFGHVSEAEDGTEALRKLEHESIHFIVSDWNMPRMTGIELLKAVRHSAKLKDLPFLLITAESHKENIIEAAQAGADGYILKPFTAAMLTQKIEAILKRKGLS